jgi:hypothetical protein
MHVRGREVELTAILNALFQDDEKSRATQALLREFRRYYQYDDPLLAEVIGALSSDHPLSRKLRQLEEEGKGPFEAEEYPISILLSPPSRLPEGMAGVCQNRDLYRRHLLLLDATRTHSIGVHASEPMTCPIGSAAKSGRLVSINTHQGKQLLRSSPPANSQGFARPTCPEPMPIPATVTSCRA